MPDLRLPAAELYSIDMMAPADTVSWWCRLCDQEATAASVPAADTAAVEHLVACHAAAVAATSVPDDFFDRLATARIAEADGAALAALLETVRHVGFGPVADAYAELVRKVAPPPARHDA